MWLYENKDVKSLEDLPEGIHGFVYLITNLINGKIYVGKKNIHSVQNKPLGKKELLELEDKRKSKKKQVIKESNWKSYWGSNTDLLSDVKEFGEDSFTREILKVCYSKKELTYFEIHFQCVEEVLIKDSYNSNILGKFYRKDLHSQEN
jgi:predicted SPOUT superfamily RNA methylase MTH1